MQQLMNEFTTVVILTGSNLDHACSVYGLGHETAAVLLPGFAINW